MIKIEVKGHLDESWSDWFEGMSIVYNDDYTVISGNIKDQSCLHGILNTIRDLNLKLISVSPINENTKSNNKKEKK